MNVAVEIEGIEAWLKVTDGDRFLVEMDRTLRQGSAMLRDAAKRMPPVSAKRTGYAALGIPVDTGLTRQKIVSKKNGPLDYSDVAETNYSGYVHDGTSRMPARPFFAWLLHDFGGLDKLEVVVADGLRRFLTP